MNEEEMMFWKLFREFTPEERKLVIEYARRRKGAATI